MTKEKIRETDTELKEEAIYQHYMVVIKQLGIRARLMNKDDIYEEVAEPFFVSKFTVGKIVRQKIKERKQILDDGLHKRLRENVELAIDAINKAKRERASKARKR